MKPLKAGLIGCGRIGSLLENDPLRGKPCTHAGAFNALPSVRLTAGCDIDPGRLRRFGAQWGVSRLYTDYREMLEAENLDLVSIAAWTHLHCEMALACARAGVRGVLCEKPIALNLNEARRMVQTFRKRGIPLVINHERRWDPYYRLAKRLIDRGRIGEVRTLIGNALSGPPGKAPVSRYGGGPLFHDGTHLTDLLLFFGGPVAWVSGQERRPGGRRYVEETACALLQFQNGAVGFIEGGGARRYFNFELDIQGSEGRLLIGNGGQALFLTRRSRRFTGFQELEPVPFPRPKRYESPFTGAVRDLVRCVRRGVPSESSGEDGLRALQLILAVYQSAQNGGRRVRVGELR